MADAQEANPHAIEPGMEVEATQGDLGAADLTKPKVTKVETDDAGNVKDVVIEKGALFRKDIVVPADRVRAVDTPATPDDTGKIVIAAGGAEIDQLHALGTDTLPDTVADDLLEQTQDILPTEEGMRRREARAQVTPEKPIPTGKFAWLKTLGPGLLGGLAGDDPSAVTSYAVAGAVTGFSQLWLLVITIPLWQAVLTAAADIGRVTQRGLTEVARIHYGQKVAIPIAALLVVANIALIGADLAAVGSGLELITGIAWEWFVVPVGAALWYLTVFQNFDAFKKVFLVFSFIFGAYLITAFFVKANPAQVAHGTFVPSVNLTFAGISSVVALLGATISPYTIFWQAQGEREEQRAGPRWMQVRSAKLDIFSGVLSGNIVSYAIIVCTAATLYAGHKSIATAADAANSLQPLVGPLAKYLFALGFIGAGFVAIPVLLASTGYVVTGTFGWAASLWKKPWQNEGFYLILTAALVVGLGLALLRVSPIQLMLWANVLQAFLAPILLILLLVIGNNRRILGVYRFGRWINIGLALTASILVAGVGLLVAGWIAGG